MRGEFVTRALARLSGATEAGVEMWTTPLGLLLIALGLWLNERRER